MTGLFDWLNTKNNNSHTMNITKFIKLLFSFAISSNHIGRKKKQNSEQRGNGKRCQIFSQVINYLEEKLEHAGLCH